MVNELDAMFKPSALQQLRDLLQANKALRDTILSSRAFTDNRHSDITKYLRTKGFTCSRTTVRDYCEAMKNNERA